MKQILAQAEVLQWHRGITSITQSLELLDTLPPDAQNTPLALTLRAYALWCLDEAHPNKYFTFDKQLPPVFERLNKALQHPDIDPRTEILTNLRIAQIDNADYYIYKTQHPVAQMDTVDDTSETTLRALANARKKLTEAAQIAKTPNPFPYLKAHIDLQEAHAILQYSNPTRAEFYLKKSIDAFFAHNDLYYATSSIDELASLYYDTQRLDELEPYAEALATAFHQQTSQAQNLDEHDHRRLWYTAEWLAKHIGSRQDEQEAYQFIHDTHKRLKITPIVYVNTLIEFMVQIVNDGTRLSANIREETIDVMTNANLDAYILLDTKISLAVDYRDLEEYERYRDILETVFADDRLTPDPRLWTRTFLAQARLILGDRAGAADVLPTPDETNIPNLQNLIAEIAAHI